MTLFLTQAWRYSLADAQSNGLRFIKTFPWMTAQQCIDLL
jgi:hypothetical protein